MSRGAAAVRTVPAAPAAFGSDYWCLWPARQASNALTRFRRVTEQAARGGFGPGGFFGPPVRSYDRSMGKKGAGKISHTAQPAGAQDRAQHRARLEATSLRH